MIKAENSFICAFKKRSVPTLWTISTPVMRTAKHARQLIIHNIPVIRLRVTAGFEAGTGVSVKISDRYIELMADGNEMQELREQLYQVQQAV